MNDIVYHESQYHEWRLRFERYGGYITSHHMAVTSEYHEWRLRFEPTGVFFRNTEPLVLQVTCVRSL